MSGLILNIGFLIASVTGVFLSSSNHSDAKGRRRDFLGLELIIGSNILIQVYSITTDVMNDHMIGMILNTIFLIAILIGSVLNFSNPHDSTQGGRRQLFGLGIILVTTMILIVYNLIVTIV